jgi:hypothetical protein
MSDYLRNATTGYIASVLLKVERFRCLRARHKAFGGKRRDKAQSEEAQSASKASTISRQISPISSFNFHNKSKPAVPAAPTGIIAS